MTVPATPRRSRLGIVVLLLAVAIALLGMLAARGVGRLPDPLRSGPPPSFAPAAPGAAVLIGAGDIARCNSDQDEATATLLDALEGTVFTLGDNVYERGTVDEFRRCYDPAWGRHRDRTRFPVAGNHDWATAGAAGYLEYFGSAARPSGATWYSADLGSWHVIVLDSNCALVGGCGAGSAQLEWLRADLAASASRCTVALWHHPRFSSGRQGDHEALDPMWRALYETGAELIVTGHDHNYERFAPQDPAANLDEARGIRQFVVGTGGTDLRSMRATQPNSEVSNADTHGVLRLELGADGYEWAFVPVAGATFTDTGTATCH